MTPAIRHKSQSPRRVLRPAYLEVRFVVFLRIRGQLVRPMRLERLAHLQIPHRRVRKWHDDLRIHTPHKHLRVPHEVRYRRDNVLGEYRRVGGRDDCD